MSLSAVTGGKRLADLQGGKQSGVHQPFAGFRVQARSNEYNDKSGFDYHLHFPQALYQTSTFYPLGKKLNLFFPPAYSSLQAAQAIKMKKFMQEGKLTDEVIQSIMQEDKPNQKEKSMPKSPFCLFYLSWALFRCKCRL